MRYFLIDKVLELVPGERAVGVKCVTLTDEVLHDHFPDHPILPGALVVEAAAQLAGVLLEASFNPTEGPHRRSLLVQIDRTKFHSACGPGDRLVLTVELSQRLESAFRVTFSGQVEDERIARGQLTFVMRDVESERVHAQRRDLYRLWLRDLDVEVL
jgi:3-hydroxyacyl-[acyl-carrier-protein] dehydratase